MRQKLTEENVRIIKTLLKSGTMTHKEIGRFFGVSREQITKIKAGKRWGDIDPMETSINRVVKIIYE